MAKETIELVKKNRIGLWLQIEKEGVPTWERVKKSTELTISLNAQTEDRDYIVDENPTQEVTGYRPEISQSLTLYKGSSDYEAIFPMAFRLGVGGKARIPAMVTFAQEKVGENAYKAWFAPSATITFTDINATSSTLTFNLSMNGNLQYGKATPDMNKKPVFTRDTSSADVNWVDPFEQLDDEDTSSSSSDGE